MKETERIPAHPSELCLIQMHFLNVVLSVLFEFLVFPVQQYFVHIFLLNLSDAVQSEKLGFHISNEKNVFYQKTAIIIRSSFWNT